MNSKETGSSADTRISPPSANGFRLEFNSVDAAGQPTTFNLVASWPAPFFVLYGLDEPGVRPGLYHANDRADAERFAQYGGRLLDAQFNYVERT